MKLQVPKKSWETYLPAKQRPAFEGICSMELFMGLGVDILYQIAQKAKQRKEQVI
jgi:hypothetical protein